jgi:hypothetical protein
MMSGVRMTVPAEARYVRAVRLVAASLAADCGFDVDELDDVRVAVDELCALFRPLDQTAAIELDFTAADGELLVSGRYLGLGEVVHADWLVVEILDATSDEVVLPSAASPTFRYLRCRER